ncbi:uncharacterized protein [Miscanthus floridulus]|uniref:uncharacterized protein isoform X2 n=1 Tax=Miscanthus floridulus TaxID=154761 RepID=UPI00345767FB
MDSAGPRRVSLKAHRPDWKSELRTNCLRRVRKDRTDLLWRIRKQGQLPANDMEKVKSAVRNIISDEIEKLKQSNEGKEDQEMDVIWEYQGPQSAKPAEIESEDILLEMERLLYEDIREELIRKRVVPITSVIISFPLLTDQQSVCSSYWLLLEFSCKNNLINFYLHSSANSMIYFTHWFGNFFVSYLISCYLLTIAELEALDEEDAYLAQSVFDHMQLNDNEAAETAKLWCPVCKQGDLRETHNLIYCTLCKLRLDLGEDKMTLEFLRERLANAHTDHFDRGCKSAPKFCLQTMFGLTALYIQCEECSTFDIVV